MKNTLRIRVIETRTNNCIRYEFDLSSELDLFNRVYYVACIMNTNERNNHVIEFTYYDSESKRHICDIRFLNNEYVTRLNHDNNRLFYYNAYCDVISVLCRNIDKIEARINERKIIYYSNTENALVEYVFSEREYKEIENEFNSMTEKQKARFKIESVDEYAKLLLTFNNI